MSVIDVVGVDAFQEAMHTQKLVLVDFWAVWCGPCKMLSPVLHELAEKYADQIDIIKINVDEEANEPLAIEYEVRSIPQVSFFKAGALIDQFIGVLPPDEIEEYIQKHLA